MQTESDSDEVIRDEVLVDEAFSVCDESTANWVVRKIVEARAYRDRVSKWAAAETLRADRQEAFLLHRFGAQLESWVRRHIGTQHGRRRSVSLPAGVVGFRQEPTKLLIVNETMLLGWCRANLPTAIKVSETLVKNEINTHLKATGECPDGAEVAGGGDRFFVK